MNRRESPTEGASSSEGLHEARLMALLDDLVARRGRMEAAEALGVNYKTLARSTDTRQLSVHMREALMALLLAQHNVDPRQQPDERLGALEQRVEVLERASYSEIEEAVRVAAEEKVAELRDEHLRWAREVEKRLARLEELGGPRAMPLAIGEQGLQPEADTGSESRHGNGVSTVVTVEPVPGDAEVYGLALPLVVEWREAQGARERAGDGLGRARAEERVRQLEVAMIEEHRLTLPPDTDPWDGIVRREQASWRRRTLARVRRERRRAEWRRLVRRVLTLGLWWE